MTPALLGRPEPDWVLRGGRLLNVFTGELTRANVLLGGGLVLGVGDDYRDAPRAVDLDGAVVLPGLIDGHLHVESSLLTPARFAETVVPRGTTTVVADPHEIANVLGLDGVRWMLRAGAGLPLDLLLMAPSCVPASRIETSGATLDAAAVALMLEWDRVLGLAEVMDVPGVLAEKPDLLRKIGIARGRRRPVDGHAPGLGGRDLDRYLAAGIESDHECVAVGEARDKLRRGMRIMIREGSQARNLRDLHAVVDPVTVRRCLLVSDDRNAADLSREGHLDHLLREAVRLGVPPLWAVQMVTLNAAEHFGLRGLGAVAPGWQADLVVVDGVEQFRAELVFKRGRLVAERGKLSVALPPTPPLATTMKANAVGTGDLRIEAPPGTWRVRVVGLVPGQIETEDLLVDAPVSEGAIVADPARDLAKLVVVERHRRTGRVGRALVRGFGLTHGALASSVAHDAHNLIAVGAGDADLVAALSAVACHGGGLAVAARGEVRACLPLPVAGLMTDAPVAETVAAQERLEREARALGIAIAHPFGTLSFLALSVVPTLRLSDQGLVDASRGDLVPLLVGA